MWTGPQFLEFIVKWVFSEFLPNLCLRLSLIICVSIASREKEHFQIKINPKKILWLITIKNKLRNLPKLLLDHKNMQRSVLTKSLTNLQKAGKREVHCMFSPTIDVDIHFPLFSKNAFM